MTATKSLEGTRGRVEIDVLPRLKSGEDVNEYERGKRQRFQSQQAVDGMCQPALP